MILQTVYSAMYMKTYNEKDFLVPGSIDSMAAYHAIVRPDGQYRFRIHDCLTSIRLHGNAADPQSAAEGVQKLRRLAGAALEFADFIEKNYTNQ
jgi:hypothetical protein